jgi:NhaP-type Na+/H+ or K+/H+ antiporter
MPGTIIPWSSFNTVELPLWRLVVASILTLILHRLPIVLLLYRYIPPLYNFKQAMVVGWFGPIGVGALWYVAYAAMLIPENTTMIPIVVFLVLVSVLCFGITAPFVHITVMTMSSFSRSREMHVPTWPSNVKPF